MQFILPRFDRTLLATTSALIGAATLFLAVPAQAAFDPNAGATAYAPTPAAATTNRLPDPSVLSGEAPARPLYAPSVTPAAGSAAPYASPLQPIQMPRPLYPSRTAVAPQPVAAPIATAPVTPAPVAAAPAIIAPAPVLAAMPAAQPEPIVLKAPVATVAVPSVSSMPNMPPVDPATAARAQAIMKAEQKATAAKAPVPQPVETRAPVAVAAAPEPTGTVSPAALPGTFIAPAPVLARAPAAATPPAVVAQPVPPAKPPVVVAAPVRSMPPAALPAPANAPAPIPVPPPMGMAAKQPVDDISPIVQPDLSSQSREMLAHVPAGLDSPKATKTTRVKLDRVTPEIQQVLGKGPEEENYESAGISIKVRRPGLDTNYELNSAYNSLMGGDTQRAIQTYKNILSTEPRNQDALFGLAATYHRLGMETEARPFYAALLKINPNHREALNNFLVLVSTESPADALPELERLEIRNPDFSPIPAQIAIVYDKLGYPAQARDKMLRAIDLAPENLTYKYNLAVMLDRQKQYGDAVALYKLLIQAALNGEQVPASIESMEKRVNYITTAANESRYGS